MKDDIIRAATDKVEGCLDGSQHSTKEKEGMDLPRGKFVRAFVEHRGRSEILRTRHEPAFRAIKVSELYKMIGHIVPIPNFFGDIHSNFFCIAV